MKKMKLLCAALTVIMLLTACSGSTSSAAEKVIGTTDKVVAADTLKPLAKADKENLWRFPATMTASLSTASSMIS